MASVLDQAGLYHDLSGLNMLRAHRDAPEALRAACQQFESFFTRQLLKTMREANEALDDDSLLDTQTSDFFREMYDDQLAVHLSKTKGLGLAELMMRQLGGQGEADHSTVVGKLLPPGETGPILPAYEPDKSPLTAWRGSEAITYPALGTLLPPVDPAAPEVSAAQRPEFITSASALSLDWGQWRDVAQSAVRDFAQLPSPLAFVKTVWPYAKKAAEALGVSPRVLIAQAALETGWGRSLLSSGPGESSNNLFNIKAGPSWDGKKATVTTLEYEGGVAVRKRANFRAYDSIMDSFADYVRLIKESPRYQEAVEAVGDVRNYTRALQEAGYATDPSYADKINRIYHSDTLVDALRSLKF